MRKNHRKEAPEPPINAHVFVPDFDKGWQETAKELRATCARSGFSVRCTNQRVKIGDYNLKLVILTAHR